MDLYGLQEDAMEVGKLGAAALAGAAIAKLVVDKGADLIAPVSKKDAAGAETLTAAEITAAKESPLRKFVVPLLPVAVGVAVHSYGKSQFPIAAPGVAAGMVAVGLGRLISNLIEKPTDTAAMDIASLLPGGRDSGLAGLGYVYDYSLQGLGYGPGDVTRYMMAGAPTQVQSLMGAPLQVQSLAGLGASPNTVSVVGPMSASLM
jgi:hypothetical protein